LQAYVADKLRILVLTTSYPSDEQDPAGIFIAKLLAAIGKRGHHLKVVAPSNGRAYGRRTLDDIETTRFGYFFPRSMEKLTTGMGGIPESMANSRLARLQVFPMMMRFLSSALLECRNSDVIYANWIGAGLVGAAVKAITGKPLVVSFRGDDGYLALERTLWRVLTLWVIRQSDQVSAVSQPLGDILSRLGTPSDRCHVPRFGVDVEMFRPAYREPTDEVKIIYVGALIRKKGVHDLLAALADERFANTRLIAVGGGADAQELTSLANQLGLQDRVEWKGILAPEEVARTMRDADVLCLPSYTEGRPNVVIEAMASGLPVVASRVGGIPDLVKENETALLHTPGDVEGLRQRLDTLITNPGLRAEMGKNGRELVMRSGLNWDTTAVDFENIFAQAVRPRKESVQPDRNLFGLRKYFPGHTEGHVAAATVGSVRSALTGAILNTVGLLIPSLLSLIMFVGLFNNFPDGKVILGALLAANVASVFLLSRFKHGAAVASYLKLGERRAAGVLGCLLAAAVIFPLGLPTQYAAMLDLWRGFPASLVEYSSQDDSTFSSFRQAASPPTATFVPATALEVSVGRDAPLAGFDPHKRDPDRGLPHLTAFHGNSRDHDDLEREVLKREYEVLYFSGERPQETQIPTP
jgi:glycosyltransferase involved in cell wall biosynthesis